MSAFAPGNAICWIIAATLLWPISAAAAVPQPAIEAGVSRELARWRTQHYRDVQYAIEFALHPGATRIEGNIEIRFTQEANTGDLVLDWRGERPGERVRDILVNGLPAFGVRFVADHLIIPGALLQAGENRIALGFQAPVGAAGALTRYLDREDGAEYLYSLFVPVEASTVFPCFDQPDLKARFTLAVTAPEGWKVIGNAPAATVTSLGNRLRHLFATSEPISTYLFAFAAGPFVELTETGHAAPVRLFARRSRAERAQKEAPQLLGLNRAAMNWFSAYFNQPFPFAKYDLVLIPELAYAGMEHAGASFLREESVLFPFDPGATDLLRRAQLLLHETSHQWFGNLVTMRWFDDLWLKEGFANFMAAKATEALLPEFPAWVAFHALKTAAYRTDVTRGTTAIRQPMANLSEAKSAYSNIVYAKAPAVLRQAEYFLGEKRFREGVRDFLKSHAYGAADWNDLVRSLERASGEKLGAWTSAWVERRGMPRVRLLPQKDKAGKLRAITIEQVAVGGEAGKGKTSAAWPMKLGIYVLSGDRARIHEVRLLGASTRLATPKAGAPQFIFANHRDHGYGQFLLDPVSRKYALENLAALKDDLLRAGVYESLWESVRAAELDPASYIELIMSRLPQEKNEIIASVMLARLRAATLRYLGDARRGALIPRIEQFLIAQMRSADSLSRRIESFRALADLATSETARSLLKNLLAEREQVPGLTLRSRDRFRILQTLLAADDPDAPRLLEEMSATDLSGEGRRYAFAAAAALPDAATKRALYTRFMDDSRLPEAWIEEALAPLNTLAHAALTAPLLEQALSALPRIKRERKIFFVNGWLDSFIGGQSTPEALQVVERFLQKNRLDEDLRLKVLEALDTLERTIRIRQRFG